MKISANASSFSPASTLLGRTPWPTGQSATQPNPLGALLFGKRPPRLLDRRKYGKLKRGLKRLDTTVEQISDILGVSDSRFSVALCEGGNASISRDGRIAFGLQLLEAHQDDDPLLTGILAHEMGHQPWNWPTGDLSHLTPRQLAALYREEEAKADRFAGKALADLGVSPDHMCEFLLAAKRFEKAPPKDYYPAEVRAEMIRDANSRRVRTLRTAGHLSPRILQRARELR